MQENWIKKWVQIALLVAAEIVLSRFLSVNTPIVRIGFGFVPIALVALFHGPVYAGIGAAAGDFLGAMLFPIGPYFPGFTLTAFLMGVVFGLFLHRQPRKLWRVGAAVAIVCVLLHLGLDTLWLHIIMGKGYLALIPTRIMKCVTMIPVMLVVIWSFCYRIISLRPITLSRKAN